MDGLVVTPVTLPAGPTGPSRFRDAIPGGRDIDQVPALVVRKILKEPVLRDPEETFVAATELAVRPDFQRARRALFDLEDDLYVDEWNPEEIEEKISGLEDEYNEVVQNFHSATRKRRVVTFLPKVAGWGAIATGHPHAKAPVEKSLNVVLGKFVSLEDPMNPQEHPGAALAMIRAAYRERFPEPGNQSWAVKKGKKPDFVADRGLSNVTSYPLTIAHPKVRLSAPTLPCSCPPPATPVGRTT